jgi:hypothetical protein
MIISQYNQNLKKIKNQILNTSFNKSIKNIEKSIDNDNSIFKIQKYLNDKLYSSKIKNKKRTYLNQFLIRNYSNYDIHSPRKIESSLISFKPIMFDKMNKIISFWKVVCNYSCPKIRQQKLKLLKTNCELNLNTTNFKKNNYDILPKLYCNSSKSLMNKKFKFNCNDSLINKNDINVFDILTKNFFNLKKLNI